MASEASVCVHPASNHEVCVSLSFAAASGLDHVLNTDLHRLIILHCARYEDLHNLLRTSKYWRALVRSTLAAWAAVAPANEQAVNIERWRHNAYDMHEVQQRLCRTTLLLDAPDES